MNRMYLYKLRQYLLFSMFHIWLKAGTIVAVGDFILADPFKIFVTTCIKRGQGVEAS